MILTLDLENHLKFLSSTKNLYYREFYLFLYCQFRHKQKKNIYVALHSYKYYKLSERKKNSFVHSDVLFSNRKKLPIDSFILAYMHWEQLLIGYYHGIIHNAVFSLFKSTNPAFFSHAKCMSVVVSVYIITLCCFTY